MRAIFFILLVVLSNMAFADYEKDFNKAIYHYAKGELKAAAKIWEPMGENDNPHAIENLANLYSQKIDGKINYQKLEYWSLKSAALGDVKSQVNLAIIYMKGLVGKPDIVRCYAWANEAAKQGHEVGKSILTDLSNVITEEIISKSNVYISEEFSKSNK